MIVKAELTHTQQIADILRLFRADDTAPEYFRQVGEDTLAGERLIIECVRSGFSFVAIDNDVAVGVLLSVCVPLPFSQQHRMAEEVIWYVLPEHRGTTVGARLFLAWQQAVRAARLDGSIVTAVCHTLERSPIDLREHGFRVLQTSFYME